MTICSPFRDSATGIAEYFTRLSELDYPMANLWYVFVEGDSQDDTFEQLQRWAQFDNRMTLIECDTGKPQHGSVVNAERFATLAQVFNAALDAVDLEWTDYVLFLPSDIHYAPDLLSRLLAHGAHIVAPFSWTEGGRFFDTWGFTRHGEEFTRFSMASGAVAYGDKLLQMDTVGGTVLISAKILAAGCRYTSDEVDRGLCKMARNKGFTVIADPTTNVFHPPFDPALLERHIPNGGNLASIANLEYETVKGAIFKKYGFTPPDAYIYDFIDFVTALTR